MLQILLVGRMAVVGRSLGRQRLEILLVDHLVDTVGLGFVLVLVLGIVDLDLDLGFDPDLGIADPSNKQFNVDS